MKCRLLCWGSQSLHNGDIENDDDDDEAFAPKIDLCPFFSPSALTRTFIERFGLVGGAAAITNNTIGSLESVSKSIMWLRHSFFCYPSPSSKIKRKKTLKKRRRTANKNTKINYYPFLSPFFLVQGPPANLEENLISCTSTGSQKRHSTCQGTRLILNVNFLLCCAYRLNYVWRVWSKNPPKGRKKKKKIGRLIIVFIIVMYSQWLRNQKYFLYT